MNELSPRTRHMLRSIRSLPVSIVWSMEKGIGESFSEERKAIRTEKQLKAFTKRWSGIWNIPWYLGWVQKRSERQVVSGRYNSKETLRCINLNNEGGGCSHLKRQKFCLSVDIMAPAFLLKLLAIRTEFGVPDDIVLLQLTRALNEDFLDQDPDLFFEYVSKNRSMW